jgi:hypothetical protein
VCILLFPYARRGMEMACLLFSWLMVALYLCVMELMSVLHLLFGYGWFGED